MHRPFPSGLATLVSGLLVALAVSTPPAVGAEPTPLPTSTAPAGTAALSGRVTDDGGAPVSGVRVHASGSGSGTTTTDASGTWTIPGLRAGGYRVEFRPSGSTLVGEYWDDAASFVTASSVRLADGEAVSGLDARLAEAAVVRGQVTDASGTPVPSATVSLERVDVLGASDIGTWTAADGTYEIRPLSAGAYRLKVVPDEDSGLSTTYWPGVADVGAATPITLRAGQVLDGVDVTPLPGQGVAGRVLLPAGVPSSEVRVIAHLVGPGGSSGGGGGTTPAADGTYRMSHLAAGTYLVHVEHIDWNGPLLPEYYRDALVAERALPVEVPAATVVTGIDLTPALAGRVTGVVTGPGGPVAGVEVTVVPRTGQVGTWGFSATGGTGEFVIGRVPAGSYSLRFTSPDGSVQYFRAPAGTTRDLHGASRLKVTAGQTVDVSVRLRGSGAP